MQVVDVNGNVYSEDNLEIVDINGKLKGPLGGNLGSVVIISSTTFTPSPTDYYLYVDATIPVTINLPSIALSNPNGYNIKNIGESTVKIVPLSPQLIDEKVEINIKNAYTSLKLVHTTTNWYIV